MSNKDNHPYHYSATKNNLQKLIDIIVPIGLFLFFFYFYNFGKITPSEMIKTSGLLSITLLGITLVVGPVCKLFPGLNFLKAHRKFWGISSAVIAFVHAGLVLMYYYKFNLYALFDYTRPKFSGFLSGLLALIILFLVTFTSNKKALETMRPSTWKAIQLTSYLALFLAISHFYLMETVNGVLVIKRLLGRITFGFAIAVIVMRLLVLFTNLSQKLKKS